MRLIFVILSFAVSLAGASCTKSGSGSKEEDTAATASTKGPSSSPGKTDPAAGQLVIDKKGVPTATEVNAQQLDLPPGVRPAGPAVAVDQGNGPKTGQVVIAIPYDSQGGTKLVDVDTSRIVVIYHVIDEGGTFTLGVIPSSDLDFSAEYISFLSRGPGNYQAALLPAPITQAVTKKVDTPVLDAAKEPELPSVVWTSLVGELTAERKFKITAAINSTAVTLNHCVVFLDEDKRYPYDQVIYVANNLVSSHFIAKIAAHDVFGRLECQDNFGRVLESQWSNRVNVPPATYAAPSFTLKASSPASDGFINASESSATGAWLDESYANQTEVRYTGWLTTPISAVCSSALNYSASALPTLADLPSGDGVYWVCVKLTSIHGVVTYHRSEEVTKDTVAPLVSAGSDVATNVALALNASVSDAVSHVWSCGNPNVLISDVNALNPNVSASVPVATCSLQLTALDLAGNSAVSALQFTWDQQAPSLSDDTVVIDDLYWNSATASGNLTFSWQAASDTVTASGALQYKVYASAGGASLAVSAIESTGTLLQTVTGGAGSITKTQANGLTDQGALRHLYIVVADAVGNKTAYKARSFMVPLGSSQAFTQISMGGKMGCGLDQEGFAFCWGYNTAGFLGIGGATSDDKYVPQKIGTRRYQKIAVGNHHICAIDLSGDAWCWGQNGFGEAGDGTIGMKTSPVLVSGGYKFKDITAGPSYSCAISVGGGAYCWGYNNFGTLGDGTTTNRSTPVAVQIDGGGSRSFVAIAAGFANACAIDVEHDLYCWGDNSTNQIAATGGNYLQAKKLAGGSNKFTAAIAGAAFVCALSTTGRVFCEGDNTDGMLGRNLGGSNYSDLVEIKKSNDTAVTNVIALSGNANTACALTVDNALYCWGKNLPSNIMLSGGTSSSNAAFLVNTGGKKATAISVGGGTLCALDVQGATHCWGANDKAQAGDATAVASVGQTQLNYSALHPVTRFASVAAGLGHTCGITGQGLAFCWGDRGNKGRLGDGSSTGEAHEPIQVVGSDRFKQIAVGGVHACALRGDGLPFCWGDNILSQIGADTSPSAFASTPIAVDTVERFTQLSLGENHSCGLTASGLVRCWGDNTYGQLGDGSLTNSLNPVGPSGTFVSVAAGYMHTCAIAANGKAYCWGASDKNQLAANSASASPVLISSDFFSNLTVGDEHSCAVRGDGLPFCWGDNANGKIGNGFGGASTSVLHQITGSPVREIVAGREHTCLIQSNFVGLCWGKNDNGQLGRGNTSDDPNMGAIVGQGLASMRSLSLGGKTSCATFMDGSNYCWGLDALGQLGDMEEGQTYSSMPSRVSEFILP